MSVKLNRQAIQNLELIRDLNDTIDDYQLVINSHIITQSDDDNYEGIFCLKELEYPIYFSFHQLFNSLRYSNLYKIDDYKTRDILLLMDDAIEKIVDILDKTEDDPNNATLSSIIDDIDNKFLILRERDETCSIWKLWETFNDYLDTFADVLIQCDHYLYKQRPIRIIVEEEENKETGETNPNLIYDIETKEKKENTKEDLKKDMKEDKKEDKKEGKKEDKKEN